MEDDIRDAVLALIALRAEREVRILAGEFARAASEDREGLLAALEFQRWLAESCRNASNLSELPIVTGSASAPEQSATVVGSDEPKS